MKKKLVALFTTLIVFTLVLTGCSSSSANNDTKTKGTLTIGLEGTFAPYSYRDNGKLTGFEVEVGKAIAKEMGLKAKFVPTKWDSLIAGLNTNTFDVVLNDVTVTPARKKQYIFAKPYLYSKSVLITKKDSSIKSIDQVKGEKLGEGTGTDNAVNAKKYGATVVPSSDFQSTVSLIQEGRIAGTLNSREAYLTWAKSHKNSNITYTLVPDSKIATAEIAPIFNKKSTHLRGRVSKAVDKLRKDGTLKKISVKYFGEDITKK